MCKSLFLSAPLPFNSLFLFLPFLSLSLRIDPSVASSNVHSFVSPSLLPLSPSLHQLHDASSLRPKVSDPSLSLSLSLRPSPSTSLLTNTSHPMIRGKARESEEGRGEEKEERPNPGGKFVSFFGRQTDVLTLSHSLPLSLPHPYSFYQFQAMPSAKPRRMTKKMREKQQKRAERTGEEAYYQPICHHLTARERRERRRKRRERATLKAPLPQQVRGSFPFMHSILTFPLPSLSPFSLSLFSRFLFLLSLKTSILFTCAHPSTKRRRHWIGCPFPFC